MSSYLYFCKNCNTLEVDSEEDTALRCPDCKQMYYPLHVTEDEWDSMSNEEKRNVLAQATMPQVGIKRDSRQNRNKKVATPASGLERDSYDNEAKISGLSIAAFVLSLIGCLSIVGLILGIVDLTKRDGRKKGLSIAAVVVGALMLVGSAAIAGNISSDKKELKSVTSESGKMSELVVDNGNIKSEQADGKQSVSAASITINEQTLVDQDGVKITAVEYVADSIWGDGIKMLLENNTSQNLMYSCDALIVNDYMISDLFAKSVAAGKSAYETLNLSNSQLRQAGIDNVGKIEIYFRVYDNDTWEDLFKTGCVTLQTSEYASMDSTVNNTGIELYNKNDIKIMAQYVDENSFWGKAILLYVENNSGQNITVSVDDLSINGFMFAPMYSDTIYAGKKSFDDITLFSSELEENGITEIKDVELKFRIYNSDTYEDIDNTDPISFSAN